MDIKNNEKMQQLINSHGGDIGIMEVLLGYSPYTVNEDDSTDEILSMGAEVGSRANKLGVKPFMLHAEGTKILFVLPKDQEKSLYQDLKVYVKESAKEKATSSANMEKIKKAIDEFISVQNELKDFGAMDTEPDTIFHLVLKRACKRESLSFSRVEKNWELYSSMEGHEAAAKKLTDAAQELYDTIKGLNLKEESPEYQFIKEYCWRSDWDYKSSEF